MEADNKYGTQTEGAYFLLQWGEAQLTLGRVQVELGKYHHALRSYDRCVVRPRCQQEHFWRAAVVLRESSVWASS